MSMMKIKKGDTVKVIAGKDKDKEGKVIAVDMKKRKVLVEGVNMITKHAKSSRKKRRLIFPTLCTFIKEKLQE